MAQPPWETPPARFWENLQQSRIDGEDLREDRTERMEQLRQHAKLAGAEQLPAKGRAASAFRKAFGRFRKSAN